MAILGQTSGGRSALAPNGAGQIPEIYHVKIPAAERLGLRVAGLTLWLDVRGSGLRLSLPAAHLKFLTSEAPDESLVLRVRRGPLAAPNGWRPLYHPSETWELWQDEQGNYVFLAPRQSPPPRQVTVDSSFSAGEVLGEFDGPNAGEGVYPLEDVDIVLFSNWLADSGDLILHAAGVDVDGAGYCFIGPSGAGKSTLAAHLAATSSAVVLGEDQVILRCLDGRFWIFGTPWHVDPDRCSPHGVPLEKAFFLDRAAAPGTVPCTPAAGVVSLLQTAFVPYYRPAAVAAILDRLALLATGGGAVPFHTLSYRLGSDVMQLIRQA